MPSTKSESPISHASPSALKAYFLASRPKTWIASISPVLIGTALSEKLDGTIFLLTLLFSLFIQIGTNYANDYFDFVKGADSKLRNGPKRATQEGWIAPKQMYKATLFVFGLALIAAFPLMIQVGLWSFFLASLCVAFGILYTGGPKPLGYLGMGEILVALFFGPVATCGTYFLQMGQVTLPVFIASLAPGLLSCSILVANNLRDEKSDRVAHKKTLIVRFGKTFGSWEYTLTILVAGAVPLLLTFFLPARIAFAALIVPVAYPWIKKTFRFKDPLELVSVLQGSAFLLFLYTLLFCVLC